MQARSSPYAVAGIPGATGAATAGTSGAADEAAAGGARGMDGRHAAGSAVVGRLGSIQQGSSSASGSCSGGYGSLQSVPSAPAAPVLPVWRAEQQLARTGVVGTLLEPQASDVEGQQQVGDDRTEGGSWGQQRRDVVFEPRLVMEEDGWEQGMEGLAGLQQAQQQGQQAVQHESADPLILAEEEWQRFVGQQLNRLQESPEVLFGSGASAAVVSHASNAPPTAGVHGTTGGGGMSVQREATKGLLEQPSTILSTSQLSDALAESHGEDQRECVGREQKEERLRLPLGLQVSVQMPQQKQQHLLLKRQRQGHRHPYQQSRECFQLWAPEQQQEQQQQCEALGDSSTGSSASSA